MCFCCASSTQCELTRRRHPSASSRTLILYKTHFSRDPPDGGHAAVKGGMRMNASNSTPFATFSHGTERAEQLEAAADHDMHVVRLADAVQLAGGTK